VDEDFLAADEFHRAQEAVEKLGKTVASFAAASAAHFFR
jgi:hypothetical protein